VVGLVEEDGMMESRRVLQRRVFSRPSIHSRFPLTRSLAPRASSINHSFPSIATGGRGGRGVVAVAGAAVVVGGTCEEGVSVSSSWLV
jgi:hypothetical protein